MFSGFDVVNSSGHVHFSLGIGENRPMVGVVREAVIVPGRNHDVIMKIPNIKFGFRNASSLKQLTICDDLLAKLDNLPADAQQDMDLPGLKAIVATAHASRQRIQMLKADLKREVANHKTHLRAAREGMRQAGSTVNFHAHIGRQDVTATGLPLAAPWKKVGLPAAPQNLRARATDYAGEIRLDWKRPVRRCLFHVEINPNPDHEKGWKYADVTRAQSVTVPGLVSGKLYWFRICAENIHGKSPWTAPASARAQ